LLVAWYYTTTLENTEVGIGNIIKTTIVLNTQHIQSNNYTTKTYVQYFSYLNWCFCLLPCVLDISFDRALPLPPLLVLVPFIPGDDSLTEGGLVEKSLDDSRVFLDLLGLIYFDLRGVLRAATSVSSFQSIFSISSAAVVGVAVVVVVVVGGE